MDYYSDPEDDYDEYGGDYDEFGGDDELGAFAEAQGDEFTTTFADTERTVGGAYASAFERLVPFESMQSGRFKEPKQRVLVAVNRFIRDVLVEGSDTNSLNANYAPFLEAVEAGPYRTDKLQYMNPYALVLGWMTQRSGKMDKKSFKGVIDKYLMHVPVEAGVTEEDVLRYARYWALVNPKTA